MSELNNDSNTKRTSNGVEKYDCAIIGGGAAGFSAGVYTGRYNMSTAIFNKEFGGDTATAGTIENWIGDLEVDGYELMQRMKQHAESVGAEVIDQEVTEIEKKDDCFVIHTDKETYKAITVILGIGAERRKLGLPNEKELTGKGVHYCVTCDGPLYKGKTVAVVGGGDSAVKGANLVAEYVEKMFLIVRGDKLKAEPINQKRMEKLGDKVEVLYETEVEEIIAGENGMYDKVKLTKEYNGSKELDTDALFIEIGAVPNTELVDKFDIKKGDAGYLEVDNMMRTGEPGLFAAGDIVNHFGDFKQDITTAAMGAVAATSAYDYYKEHGEEC